MAVTMDDVVRSLLPDEADLNQAAAALGPEALPHLERLVQGSDPMLASKATYVAGQIQAPGTMRILEIAARSEDRGIRITAATTVGALPPDEAGELLNTLLTDDDPEIRRLAVESVPAEVVPRVREVLERIARSDPFPMIRDLSAGVLGSRGQSETPTQEGDEPSA